ncbi:hypothetical protein IEE94_15490 [Yimella sp. cx-573]|nr:hypothetical protein [Yimella sp. cx-573]
MGGVEYNFSGSSGKLVVSKSTLDVGQGTLGTGWATDGKTTRIEWNGAEGAPPSYTVTRNDVPLGTTSESFFIDRTPNPDAAPVVYSIDGPSADGTMGNSWTIVVEPPAVGASPATYKPGTGPNLGQGPNPDGNTDAIGTPSTSPDPSADHGAGSDEIDPTANASAIALKRTVKVWYRTFIPNARVSVPKGAPCDYNESTRPYGGDNRGYSTNPYASFRTQQAFQISWDIASNDLPYSNQTSTTHVYNTEKGGILWASKKASTTGMSIKRMTGWNSQYQDIRGSVYSGNPFCSKYLGAINTSWRMHFEPNGTFAMSGSHRQMPSHEVVIRAWSTYDIGPYQFVYRRDRRDPSCLIGAAFCPYAPISGRGTARAW